MIPLRIERDGDGFSFEGSGKRFSTVADAVDALQRERPECIAIVPTESRPLPSHWLPAIWGLGGPSPDTTRDSLLDAAGAIARAMEHVRDTVPHPRDGEVAHRRPAWEDMMYRLEDICTELQIIAGRCYRDG